MLFLFVNMTRYLCLKFNMFKKIYRYFIMPKKGKWF